MVSSHGKFTLELKEPLLTYGIVPRIKTRHLIYVVERGTNSIGQLKTVLTHFKLENIASLY